MLRSGSSHREVVVSTLRCLILAAVVALVAACLIVRRASIEEIERTADSVTVISPVKAHLLDGTTVLYPDGVTLARNILSGDGTRYDLALKQLGPAPDIPLDSVLGLETYQSGVNGPATIGVSLLATVGTIALSVAIYCATDPKCFGSCPTFYSDSAGTAVLEAEGFSYSVAPLFESRDVDRLRLRAGPTGAVRLEVRNEAYETHYLNQLELLEVHHRADEFVATDPAGRPVAVTGLQPVAAARDRAGQDLHGVLAAADGDAFRTDPRPRARTVRPSSSGCGTACSTRCCSTTSCWATPGRAPSTGWPTIWSASVRPCSSGNGMPRAWGCGSPCARRRGGARSIAFGTPAPWPGRTWTPWYRSRAVIRFTAVSPSR